MEVMSMKKMNRTVMVFLIVMSVLAFSNLIKLEMNGETVKPAGIMVFVGIAAFFITRKTNDSKEEGLNIRTVAGDLKNIRVVILLIMPLIMNIITSVIEKRFMPEVWEHIKERTAFLDTSQVAVTVISLIILALGEEIALRGFFQKQTTKMMGFIPSLIITSIVFSMGHFAYDEPFIVAADLTEIFINSIFYGLVFRETDNAWCSWLSHFLANVLALFILL
jgi:membrane protease YdiL (CAAX protease family)